MRQLLKFAVALCVAVAVVIAVRMAAFTVCTAPVSIGGQLRAGSRVVVNKLRRCADFRRGDLMAFTVDGSTPRLSLTEPPQQIGMVAAVPGDTITVRGQRYRIPYKCCDRCQCADCRLYLVDTGSGRRLVHKHQVVGRVVRFGR